MTTLKNINENKFSDLFSSRREKERITLPLLKSNKDLVKIGIFTGGIIFALSLSFTVVLIIHSFYLRSVRYKLSPFVQESDNYLLVINSTKKKIEETDKYNKQLIQAILDIRSGSAILSSLRTLIPQPISLTQLQLNDQELEIKGKVKSDNGLEILNAYIFELMNADIIKSETVRLIKANSDGKSESDFSNLSFIIKGSLIDDINKINKNSLEQLGSFGFDQRIKILRNRGLIK